jgi:chromosome partitioning protein
MGLTVLLVDADPQGSLTQGFLGSTTAESLAYRQTLAAVFDDDSFVNITEQLLTATAFTGITLIPANQYLAPYNVPAPENCGMKQFALRQLLDAISGFDVTLIDCPPNLYMCSWAAMVASDYVIIPVPPEDFGTQGLRTVHQAIEHARRLSPSLRRLGHLITRHDGRLLIHQSYAARLRAMYGESLFDTIVPEVAAFKVALACGKPVSFYDDKVRAARLTNQLAREILDRIGARDGRLQVA